MSLFTILVIAALAGAGVWWYQRRRRALEGGEKKDLAGLERLDLIGCTGAVASDGLEGESGSVRLVDKSGEVRVLPARLVDAEAPLRRGQEVLVIENPRHGGPVTVVPNDLPGLEDLSG